MIMRSKRYRYRIRKQTTGMGHIYYCVERRENWDIFMIYHSLSVFEDMRDAKESVKNWIKSDNTKKSEYIYDFDKTK